jgi:hypothetical protein
LRKSAKIWGVTLIKNNVGISWGEFKHEMVVRFTNHRKTDETLGRFLSTPEVNSFDDYIQLLRDARVVMSQKVLA